MFQDRRGICQFVPLDHRPPPIDLQLLHFPPPFLFTVLSTVPSPTHLLFRFFTEFQVLFSSLSANIPSTSSPFLLFHFFYFRPLFLLRFSFSVFTPFSSYRSADLISHIFQGFFFLTDRHAADLPSGWLAKNRGDSKISFICLNPGIRSGNSPRENPAFFNKIPRKRQ